jgi:hypothetical protein
MASQKSSAKSEMQHGYSCLPAKAYGFASLQNRTLKAAGQKQGPDFSTRACIRRSLFGDLPSDPHDRTGNALHEELAALARRHSPPEIKSAYVLPWLVRFGPLLDFPHEAPD